MYNFASLRSHLKMWSWFDLFLFIGLSAPPVLLGAMMARGIALDIAEELRRWPAAQRRLLGAVLLLGG